MMIACLHVKREQVLNDQVIVANDWLPPLTNHQPALLRFVLFLQTLYSHVPACQVTTYYYVGFAYLMMRRYQDAIRSFTSVLLYIQRAKPVLSQSKSYQYDQVSCY